MRIAVVGAGVSGLVAAYLLAEEHEVTLFEAAGRLGGHAHTVEVEHEGRSLAVDTGFMVFNEATYPRFTRLLQRLGVGSRRSDMSFSVRNETTGLEYCGSSLQGLFAQPGNLVRRDFLGMLADVVRFNRNALEITEGRPGLTLGELLETGGFGPFFRDHYLVPMTAAVWSTAPARVLEMPASFLVRFLDNHNLLTVDGHYPWRTVVGGSARYVESLVAVLAGNGGSIRLRTPVERVERPAAGGVRVVPAGGGAEAFDRAVLAVHADRALALLAGPSAAEREVLSAFPCNPNRGVLHTDASVLPRSRRAWASWNYHVAGSPEEPASVTYDLSRLQGLPGRTPLLLTLNREQGIDPAKVIRRFSWEHPRYTLAGVAAQERRGEVSGVDRIHYCGAYWRNGFHEDGVASAAAAVYELALDRARAERTLDGVAA